MFTYLPVLRLVLALLLAAPLISSLGCLSRPVKPLTESVFQNVAFQIGDTTIHAHMTRIGANNLTMLNLHEDEQTSVQAGRVMLLKYGGRLIQLVHSGQRRVVFSLNEKEYSFDPNRIFSETGVRKTLSGDAPIPEEAYAKVDQFAAEFVRTFALEKRQPLITLHNNGEGGLSIHSYQPGAEYEADTDKLFINPEADPDDFFYVTHRRFFNELKKLRFNVILQNNRILRDDGSLSVFAGRHKIPYLNAEAQMDHLDEQIRMLDEAVKLSR